MSKQQFQYSERRAFWEAYGHACAYCGEPLRFREMHIDHIVPEYLAEKPAEWEIVRSSLGLSQDFDLRSYANLLPSCSACNSRKLASILSNTPVHLAQAGRKQNHVIALRDKIKVEIAADKLRIAISAALEVGTISRQQAALMIAEPNLQTYISGTVLDLIQPDLLHDMTVEDYEACLDIQATSHPIEVGLTHDGRVREVIATLREYRDKMAVGYFPSTQADMNNAYIYFEMPLGMLSILRQSAFAETSFVREPYVGLADIVLLPSSLLLSFDDTIDRSMLSDRKTIRDLVLDGEVRITDVGSNQISFEWQSWQTFLFELIRTDIDGDGIEEILISIGGRPLGGTLRIARLAALSRKSPTESLTVLEDLH